MSSSFSRLAAVMVVGSVLLPGQQSVWFTPVPAGKHPVGYFGSADYMALFRPEAPWRQAAAKVRVFKVYADGLDALSDADLAKMLADLKRRKIALALEWPILTSRTCGNGI